MKKRFVEKNVIAHESVKNFYPRNAADRYIANEMRLMPVAVSLKTSWVWHHFRKFDTKVHSDLKECACCNHCFEASKKNVEISFVVPYSV